MGQDAAKGRPAAACPLGRRENEEKMTDILLTILGAAAVALLWVALYDSNRFVVRKLTVADKRVRKHVRAAVLADLHNKQYGSGNERLLQEIRKQKPDLILVAGDLVTARPGKSLEPAVKLLGELAGEYPVYYGNGNHEHRMKLYPETYGDMALRYGEALAALGIEPLVNEKAVLAEYGIAVCGAEIGKEFYRRFQVRQMPEDYMTNLLGQAPGDLYTVLLAHNPDYFPMYAKWGADLVVSGHVHGGVVRIPFLNRGVLSPGIRLFPRYDGGVFHEGKSTMLLSRGLGMHTIPVRLFNPAELWIVDFEPQPDPEPRPDKHFS